MSNKKNCFAGCTPASFYQNYVKDNAVFEGMPENGWKHVAGHTNEVLQAAIEESEEKDEWCAVEAAVRGVLRKAGYDSSTW